MGTNLTDPAILRELFSSDEFIAALKEESKENALQLYYGKAHGGAKPSQDSKNLKEEDVLLLLKDVFDIPLSLLYWAAKADHYEIALEPIATIGRRDRLIVRLQFDGTLAASFEATNFSSAPSPKIKISKSEMRERILSLGYLPND